MKKLSYFLMLLAGCSIMFASCIDNDESDSIKKLRESKASEQEAMAAYLNAQAQAELILAQAEADYKAAMALVEAANAAFVQAQAALLEIEAKIQELEAQRIEGSINAEIEAAIAAAKALAAEYAVKLQEQQNALKEAQYELELLEWDYAVKLAEAEADYEAAMIKLKAYIAELRAEANDKIAALIDQYLLYMSDIAGKELDALELALQIQKDEANLLYAQKTEAFDKDALLKKLNADVIDAQQDLDDAQYELAVWKELEADIEKAEELIADVEADIKDLKADRIEAKNAADAAEDAKDEAEETRDAIREMVDGWIDPVIGPGFPQTSYTSLRNGTTFTYNETIESIKSLIAVAEADETYIQGIYDALVAEYNDSIAKIQPVAAANDAASDALVAAESAWEAAYNVFNPIIGNPINSDYTAAKNAFLAADEAYSIAYAKYNGGIPDGTQPRPSSVPNNLLPSPIRYDSDDTNYAPDADPTLATNLTAADAAWTLAEAVYAADPTDAEAIDKFLAADEAYCYAYVRVNGGIANGTQLRPDGSYTINVTQSATYDTDEDYEGTNVIYTALMAEIAGLQNAVQNRADQLAETQAIIASMNDVEDALGKIDDAEDAYQTAFNQWMDADNELNRIDTEIADKEALVDELKLIQTILGYDDPLSPDTYAMLIDDIKDKIEALEDDIEGYHDGSGNYVKGLKDKLADAQFDLDNYEEKYLNDLASVTDLVEYLEKSIANDKAELERLQYEIDSLNKLAENLKAAIDSALDE